MSRLQARFGRVELVTALVAVIAGLLLVADRASAEEEPGQGFEDNPPTILGGAVSPSHLSYEGGDVQLSVDIIDDFGLTMVYAQVYDPYGTTQLIQLYQGNETTYYGTLGVPPNYSESEVAYWVEVQAYDTNGAYVATTIGSVQIEAAPQFDEAPYVSNAQLTPTFLPPEGGPIAISVEASDNSSVSSVFATIALPAGGSTEVPLQPVGSNRYEGTFTAPANAGPLGAEYLVEVSAQDDVGQESRVGVGTVTVAAPPPPVSSGQLKLSPGSSSFGSVKVGGSSTRTLSIRNTGPADGAPVEVTARLVGSSAFALVGAAADGSVHLSLRPGGRSALAVEFRPTGPGEQAATLNLARDDGAQAGLGVDLSGRGTAKR